jgi:hypothetical protein
VGLGLIMFMIRRRVSYSIPCANLRFLQVHSAKLSLGVVYPWTPQAEDDDTEYYDVPAKSPRDAFQSLIDKYRCLQYISRPTNAKEGEFQLFVDECHIFAPENCPDEVHEIAQELQADWSSKQTGRFRVDWKGSILSVAGGLIGLIRVLLGGRSFWRGGDGICLVDNAIHNHH